MAMTSKSFKKAERLHKKKLIQELFSKGSSFYLYPFKVIVTQNPDPTYPVHQILITVPKKNHKTAVARNRIKRQIREAYRLNKFKLLSPNPLLIAYIYTAKEPASFDKLEKSMIGSLDKLTLRFKQDEEKA